MLLDGKAAVVYGGAGAMGSAVAQAFAREGARVFLAGRTQSRLRRSRRRSGPLAASRKLPRSTR
jgi:3-oxoacyl-[acyl-carrier protein] reductase